MLGWSAAEPTLRLDHRQFAYAGNFRVGGTGKAVARESGTVLAAASFSPDRTDDGTLVVRYVTVRRDSQGEGLGPRLLRYVAERARERSFETVRIAVNNPVAYEACYRAGFAFTGEESGVAELVLVYAPDGDRVPEEDRSPEAYRRGLSTFAGRDLPPDAASFVEGKLGGEPPPPVPDPG